MTASNLFVLDSDLPHFAHVQIMCPINCIASVDSSVLFVRVPISVPPIVRLLLVLVLGFCIPNEGVAFL